MEKNVRLFVCGDVMTGRGIDQILPHASDPQLYERHVRDAREYVRLAERAHGKVSRPVDYGYIWGDVLEVLDRFQPQVRVINLETAVTSSNQPLRGKGIHYRMHPDNLPCLTEAGVDVCSLANNHVLDWGYEGLGETLGELAGAEIQTCGAGLTQEKAQRPAVIRTGEASRLVVFGMALASSGVPASWKAGEEKAGVHFFPDLSRNTIQECGSLVREHTREGDLIVLSVHWGGNWGYRIPNAQQHFAHRMIEDARVDIIHGHSSHHVKGVEVYRGRLILYGCGDFINDYEGIKGRERFRGDLTLMYFPELDPESGRLNGLSMVPLQRWEMQLQRAGKEDALWLLETLNREGAELGTTFRLKENGDIVWAA